jgi:hypothetical protein
MTGPLADLADKGILGLLLVVALGAVAFMFREYVRARDARDAETANRIGDVQRFNEAVLKAHHEGHEERRQVYDATSKLHAMIERTDRAEQVREAMTQAALERARADAQREWEQRQRDEPMRPRATSGDFGGGRSGRDGE